MISVFYGDKAHQWSWVPILYWWRFSIAKHSPSIQVKRTTKNFSLKFIMQTTVCRLLKLKLVTISNFPSKNFFLVDFSYKYAYQLFLDWLRNNCCHYICIWSPISKTENEESNLDKAHIATPDWCLGEGLATRANIFDKTSSSSIKRHSLILPIYSLEEISGLCDK